MDTQRLILVAIFCMSGYFLWDAWQRQHAPPPPPSAVVQPGAPAVPGSSPPVPTASAPGAVPGTGAAAAIATAPAPTGENIAITTDLYRAEVNTVGGAINQLVLSRHRDTNDADKPYVLLQLNDARTFTAQSGLLGEGLGLPNHRSVWQALPGPRELAPGQDSLDLKLQTTTANGTRVVETLTFHRGTYVIDVAYDITNAGTAPIGLIFKYSGV